MLTRLLTDIGKNLQSVEGRALQGKIFSFALKFPIVTMPFMGPLDQNRYTNEYIALGSFAVEKAFELGLIKDKKPYALPN